MGSSCSSPPGKGEVVGSTARLQEGAVSPSPAEDEPVSPTADQVAWLGVETGKRECIAGYSIVHGEPDEMGRTERWQCKKCEHLSPGNLDGFGWTSCQACGARAGEPEQEEEEEQEAAASQIDAAFCE